MIRSKAHAAFMMVLPLADMLRASSKAAETEGPKRTELLEKRRTGPKSCSPEAVQAGSGKQQQQQQQRGFSTAARGFAASATRSVHGLRRAL